MNDFLDRHLGKLILFGVFLMLGLIVAGAMARAVVHERACEEMRRAARTSSDTLMAIQFCASSPEQRGGGTYYIPAPVVSR